MYMVNPFTVTGEDSSLFSEIMNIMVDLPDRIEQFTLSATVNGQTSGRKLIQDLLAEHALANHRDRALMVATRDKFVAAGLNAELSLPTLTKWWRSYRRLNHQVAAASRHGAETMVQTLHTIVYKDHTFREKFDGARGGASCEHI